MLENALDYEGLKYYDEKSKDYVDNKVANLQTQMDTKAPIASPTLTGAPKAPTAASGTNTTQIATTAFVQTEIGNLINGAPETANTLKELSDLIEEHQDVTDALNEAIGKKANASDLTTHTGNTTVHITSTERTNWNNASTNSHTHSNKAVLDATTASYTIALNTKLSGIEEGANAYTHPNSGATAGTYRSVTVNAQGHVTAGSNPTTTVAQGGTGATTLASGQALIGNGTGAVTTRAITNNTAIGDLGYTTTNATTLSTLGTLAYWNGRYNSTKSNLAYCNRGAFGTAATYAATTSITSGGTGLITSGAVYTGLSGKAPTSHATTALTYGGGTASNYGHVKLSDSYTSSAGAASASVAASSKAVADAYAAINSNLAKGLVVDYEYLSYSDSDNNQEGALVTTTKTSYSTQIDPITNAHRKFSSYQYLCFELLVNNNSVRDTRLIPRIRFTDQSYIVTLFYVDSINVQRWVEVTFNNDTSFYMIGSSNIVTNTRVAITGLKAKLL